ncbi:unnamed protein product [Urochloa decumbens]|uniref:Uncharacterized protein n=1 Tax=Urochloa decumbens TaxID=240449 RepID=A0ABC8X1C8_9POAL
MMNYTTYICCSRNNLSPYLSSIINNSDLVATAAHLTATGGVLVVVSVTDTAAAARFLTHLPILPSSPSAVGGCLRSDHADLPELPVQVPSVELPGPPREHQRHERAEQRDPGDDQERLLEAPHPDAREVLPLPPALPQRLPVVHPPRDPHVEDVRPDGARHGPEVVERGVVLEPEHLGDDGEQQRPLRPEAEAQDHGRRVEPVADPEGDERVAHACEEEHRREHQRAWHLVLGQHVLGREPGHHPARVVPDADERHERGYGALRVPQRLPDLAHVVDGSQRAADPADGRHEQHQHVHAEERLQDRVVLAPRRRPEHVLEARRRRAFFGIGGGGGRWRCGRACDFLVVVDGGDRRRCHDGGGRRERRLEVCLKLLLDDDDDGEEDEEEEHGGRDVVRRLGEVDHLQLHDVHDEEVHGEHDGCVEEQEEDPALPPRRPGRVVGPRQDAYGGDEEQRDGGGEPRHEEHELGAVVVGAVDGAVELGEDGAAEADEPLEQTQHDAPVLGEVLHGGDERARVGERLRVGAHGDVHAHEPHGRAGGAAGHGEVDHEVAGEVHAGAGGEHDPRRGHLVDEAREDAHVGAHVLEEAQRVERLLVVAQRRLHGLGVDAEDVGPAGRRHDQDGSEEHEPPPAHHVPREPHRARGVGAGDAARGAVAEHHLSMALLVLRTATPEAGHKRSA